MLCVCFLHLFNLDATRQQVVINLGLVYKVQHHSGVFFQFVAFIRKRKRTVPDIIAAGGRYDHLVGFITTSLYVVTLCLLFFVQGLCFSLSGFNSVLLDCGVSRSSLYCTSPLCCGSKFILWKSLFCPGYHGGASKKHTLSHTQMEQPYIHQGLMTAGSTFSIMLITALCVPLNDVDIFWEAHFSYLTSDSCVMNVLKTIRLGLA